MSPCIWLDLETLGSQPIMPQNVPRHLIIHVFGHYYLRLKRKQLYYSIGMSIFDVLVPKFKNEFTTNLWRSSVYYTNIIFSVIWYFMSLR